jgi:hypothetical protein
VSPSASSRLAPAVLLSFAWVAGAATLASADPSPTRATPAARPVEAARSAAPQPGATPAPAITKGPYLQGLTTTAVVVKVELADAATARVEVLGPDAAGAPAFRATVESSGARRFHVLRVAGLAPATSYTYRVGVAGAPAADAGRFTTAPADARPFKFVLYGDNRSDTAAHAAVVRAVERAEGDFLVHTGDMVYEGSSDDDWTSFFAVEGRLLRDRCVFASIGNHELYGSERAGESAFLRYFAAPPPDGADRPRLYASFRWSNARFFLLNAMDDWVGAERDWLRAELERAKGEPGLVHRIAVLHHGPFSSGPHGANARLADGGVLDVLRDGKVDLVLAGHDHIYERGEGAGLKYVVSGGAGAPLYPRKRSGAETLSFESVHHFVRVGVDGDRIDLVAERVSGGVIERCGFRVGGPWECGGAAAAKAGAGGGAPVASSPAPVPPRAHAAGGCGCAAPGSTGGGHGAALLGVALGLAAARGLRRRAG